MRTAGRYSQRAAQSNQQESKDAMRCSFHNFTSKRKYPCPSGLGWDIFEMGQGFKLTIPLGNLGIRQPSQAIDAEFLHTKRSQDGTMDDGFFNPAGRQTVRRS